MKTPALVLMARSRRLRRVAGLADILTLRLEALVPPDRESRVVIVEQTLSRRDAERILAAFDRQVSQALGCRERFREGYCSSADTSGTESAMSG